MIAVEEGGVDFHTLNETGGHAERDYHPVERVGVVAAGFPPVVPGSGGDVNAGAVDWGSGIYEVGSVGEELVGAGEDAGPEGGGGEV